MRGDYGERQPRLDTESRRRPAGNFQILLALADSERHGYAIMKGVTTHEGRGEVSQARCTARSSGCSKLDWWRKAASARTRSWETIAAVTTGSRSSACAWPGWKPAASKQWCARHGRRS